MDIALYTLFAIIFHLFIFAFIYQKKFLTWPDGILVAGLVSFLIFLANFSYWIILFIFFIPASLISKSNQERKKNEIIFEKSSQRNAYQVLANSFGLLFFALMQLTSSGVDGKIIFIYLFSGAAFIASASSDTWSTEIGTLNKSEPYFILNLRKKVPKGTSGGVSILGTFGALFGSFLIGFGLLISFLIENTYRNFTNVIIAVVILLLLGFCGSIIDSILGASVQKKYLCPNCNKIVEENYHPLCETNNLKKIRNYTFLDNNTVNLTSNLTITIFALLLIIITHFNPI